MSQNLTIYPISQMPNITSPDPHPNLPFSVIRICPLTLLGMVSLSNHFGFRCRPGPARLQTGRIRISRLPYLPAPISYHRQDNFQPRFPYENRSYLIIFSHLPSTFRRLSSIVCPPTHQLPITSRKHRASSIENPSHQPNVQNDRKCPLSVLKPRF